MKVPRLLKCDFEPEKGSDFQWIPDERKPLSLLISMIVVFRVFPTNVCDLLWILLPPLCHFAERHLKFTKRWGVARREKEVLATMRCLKALSRAPMSCQDLHSTSKLIQLQRIWKKPTGLPEFKHLPFSDFVREEMRTYTNTLLKSLESCEC